MSAATEEEMLKKAEDIISHLAEGGTLKSLAGLGDDELEAIYTVAYNHFSAHKYDQAIQLFKFLCLYDHTEPRWFLGLGAAHQEKKDFTAAVDAYGLATLLDVDDPRPQVQAGYCLLALERWPEAKSALEGAIMTCGGAAEHARVREQAEAMLAKVDDRKAGKSAKPGKGKK